jgi:glycosyltransferase involved in cell wall biosynthesis
MVGFVETPAFLPCCDVVLMPSRIDGRPNVLLEALAMGIPVIATAIGGIPEVLAEGKVGFLCKSPDPDEFRDALLTLLSMPDLLHEMKVNARRRAENSLGIEKTLTDYESLFHELADLKRGL